ncbi:sigma factor [Nocardia testacea]|uniref:Sigma factor n=1 Tax=Nocardia testacea TaxID=248551 RepID=A0ABW7VVD8_9NOCA
MPPGPFRRTPVRSDPSDLVTEAFEAQRERLRALAYRVLGSHPDAEDVVQEAWMRLARQDEATIANLAGWLTTVVGRRGRWPRRVPVLRGSPHRQSRRERLRPCEVGRIVL